MRHPPKKTLQLLTVVVGTSVYVKLNDVVDDAAVVVVAGVCVEVLKKLVNTSTNNSHYYPVLNIAEWRTKELRKPPPLASTAQEGEGKMSETFNVTWKKTY